MFSPLNTSPILPSLCSKACLSFSISCLQSPFHLFSNSGSSRIQTKCSFWYISYPFRRRQWQPTPVLLPPTPSCPGRLERFVLLTPPKLPTLGLRASLVFFVSDVFLYIKASGLNKVNQPYIYIYPLFLGFSSHLCHQRALSSVPCAIQSVLIIYLFYA